MKRPMETSFFRKRVWVLVLLASLVACGAREAKQEGVVDRVNADLPPAAEPIVKGPSRKSATPKASLCQTPRHVVFACVLEAPADQVALCASADDEVAIAPYFVRQTAAGRSLQVRAEGSLPIEFRRTHLMFTGGTGGYAYSFDHGGVTHVMYAVSGAHGYEKQGVFILPKDLKELVDDERCRSGTFIASEETAVMKTVQNWRSEPVLRDHGIPAFKRDAEQ